MAHYIDKDALVAEIKRRKDWWYGRSTEAKYKREECDDILTLIDTLEVKEVDFETAAHGRIDYPFIGHDFPNIYPNYKELKDYCDKNGIKDKDKIKIIIIKDGIL